MNEDKAKESAPVQSETPTLTKVKVNITGEANQIIRRAQARDSRVVAMGPLVFFSSESGDAWMLDTEDGLAVCLVQEGEKQPFTITETPSNFGIEWNATYHIAGDQFFVVEPDGKNRTILGYPTKEILRCSRLLE
jgi:hypothetical protein